MFTSAAGLRGVTPFCFRPSGGINGGLLFNVRISRNACITLSQAQSWLNQVAQRFMRASFYSKLRAKQIEVCFVSRQDLQDLGYPIASPQIGRYQPPEQIATLTFLGIFDSHTNTVFINTEDINLTNDDHLEIIFHEFLHAYSTVTNRNPNGSTITRSGIFTIQSDSSGKVTYRRGYQLNEGLTEYVRIKSGGMSPVDYNAKLFSAIEVLAQHFGEDPLIEAYFNQDSGILQRAFERRFGNKAWEELCFLADFAFDDQRQCSWNDLQQFARYGFGWWMMQAWGYSHENMARAPREIPVSALPFSLRIKLWGLKIRIYTNLTAEELARYLFNIRLRSEHRDPYGYLHYRRLRTLIASANSLHPNSAAALEIVYRPGEGQASAVCFLKCRDKSQANEAYFLGLSTQYASWLFDGKC
ncbi:MAG: hypothetical protein QME05_01600 [Candidatus Margulisbacteria bacterium]|nr:hypothetical protein [Candidatus Margulisiibacteriota bacterium]